MIDRGSSGAYTTGMTKRKRIRTVSLTMRMSPEESALLDELAAEREMLRPELVRQLIRDQAKRKAKR